MHSSCRTGCSCGYSEVLAFIINYSTDQNRPLYDPGMMTGTKPFAHSHGNGLINIPASNLGHKQKMVNSLLWLVLTNLAGNNRFPHDMCRQTVGDLDLIVGSERVFGRQPPVVLW